MPLQCEALGEETGCWLMFAAHAGGDTTAVHYTSRALRRDAVDETTAMVKDFMTTTSRLKLAKRRHANDLVRQLAAKEAELVALKAASEAEIAMLRAEYEQSQSDS